MGNPIERVQRLVNFYREFPSLTIDMLDSATNVTIQDLRALLRLAMTDTQQILFDKIRACVWALSVGEQEGNIGLVIESRQELFELLQIPVKDNGEVERP